MDASVNAYRAERSGLPHHERIIFLDLGGSDVVLLGSTRRLPTVGNELIAQAIPIIEALKFK